MHLVAAATVVKLANANPRAPVLGAHRDLEDVVVLDAPVVEEFGEFVHAVDGEGELADVDAAVVEAGARGRIADDPHAAAAVVAAVVRHRALRNYWRSATRAPSFYYNIFGRSEG